MARKRRRQDPRKMQDQFQQDSSSGKFLKHQSGQVITVRVLPSWDENRDDWYFKQLLHYGFKDLEDEQRSRTIPCMKYHFDLPVCPVCAVTEFLFDNSDTPGYEAKAKELMAKKRFLVNVLQKLSDEKYEFSIMGAGPMVMNALTGYISKPGYGDITDEETGWWMYIEKKGQGFNTSYDVTPEPGSQGPIPVKDWDQRLYDLEKELPQLTYEQAYTMLTNRLEQDHPGLVSMVCPHPSTVADPRAEKPTATRKKTSKKPASSNGKKKVSKKVAKKAPARKKAGRR